MTKLQLKNISKNFGETKILHNINLTVSDGEFVVLVGPSGSGKSTILRIIAGLEQPTSGQIEIDGKPINDLPPKDRDIAMVFQNYALYPHMNIYDNLAFPLKMKNTNKDTINNLVNETSELLGIRTYLSKKPKELSGGERQRVALGRAIIRKPKFFLMDEPLSNLDAKLRTQMRAELLKIHKTLSKSVVYVTHDQTEALTMGNKIIVLNKGEIQQEGSPLEIYEKPCNVFVAGFIGNPAMNFFNLTIKEKNKISLFDREISLELPDKVFEAFKAKNLLNKQTIFGIRPENIDLTNHNNSKNQIEFTANVELIEMLGNEHLIHANWNGKSKGSTFSVRHSGKSLLKQNESAKISFDITNGHFFDSATGERINL